MKTILTPIDFSAATRPVVAAAGALARALPARVALIHIVRPPGIVNEYAPEIERLIAVAEKSATRQLAQWREELERDGTETETIQLLGPPVSTILQEAERLDADYIVMGSHGHTALHDLLVGSTTRGVLRKAACPVLIVPPAEKRPGAAAAEPSSAEASLI
jgi:nucleotide-binding universal stress UspA family protein